MKRLGALKVEIPPGDLVSWEDFDAPRQNPSLAAACAGYTWTCESMQRDPQAHMDL